MVDTGESHLDESSVETSEGPIMVKVLCSLDRSNQWKELGIGRLSTIMQNEECKNALLLLVLSDNNDSEEPLLKADISKARKLSKQDPNVITWSRADNGEFALSFFSPSNCLACWTQIELFKKRQSNLQLDHSTIDPWVEGSNVRSDVDRPNSAENRLQDSPLDTEFEQGQGSDFGNTGIDMDILDQHIDQELNMCDKMEMGTLLIGNVDELECKSLPGCDEKQTALTKTAELSNEEISKMHVDVHNLALVAEMFADSHLVGFQRRAAMVTFLYSNNYRLVDLCGFCCDIDDEECLFFLNAIVRGMLRLNDQRVYAMMFDDEESTLQYIDVLEPRRMSTVKNQPSEPEPEQQDTSGQLDKTPLTHRIYLEKNTFFNDVARLSCSEDANFIALIHKTFRIQYILDVIMPASFAFENNYLSGLKEFLISCKNEIINHMMESLDLVTDLAKQIPSISINLVTISNEKIHCILKFFRELCSFIVYAVAGDRKQLLLQGLIECDLLTAVHNVLTYDSTGEKGDLVAAIKNVALEIFNLCVEHSVIAVREFCLTQIRGEERKLPSAIEAQQRESSAMYIESKCAGAFSTIEPDAQLSTDQSNILKSNILSDPSDWSNQGDAACSIIRNDAPSVRSNNRPIETEADTNSPEPLSEKVELPLVERAPEARNLDGNSSLNDDDGDPESILEQIVGILVESTDPESPNCLEIANTMKVLVHRAPGCLNMSFPQRETSADFLQLYFDRCIPILLAPILVNTVSATGDMKDDKRSAQLQYVLLDILSFLYDPCPTRMNFYFIKKGFVSRVALLLSSKHQIVRVAALRLIRRIMGTCCDDCDRYLIDNGVLMTVANKLLDSKAGVFEGAVLEIFDFMTKEERNMLIEYSMENIYEKLRHLSRTRSVFASLKTRYADLKEAKLRGPNVRSSLQLSGANQFGIVERDDPDEIGYFEDEEPSSEENNTSRVPLADASAECFTMPLRKRSDNWNCCVPPADDDTVEQFGRKLGRRLSSSSIVFKLNISSRSNDPQTRGGETSTERNDRITSTWLNNLMRTSPPPHEASPDVASDTSTSTPAPTPSRRSLVSYSLDTSSSDDSDEESERNKNAVTG